MNETQVIEMINEWLKTPLLPNANNNPYISAANCGIVAARSEIKLILEMYELNKEDKQ